TKSTQSNTRETAFQSGCGLLPWTSVFAAHGAELATLWTSRKGSRVGSQRNGDASATAQPAASRAYGLWPAQHKAAMESPSQRHGGSQSQGAEPSPCKSTASALRCVRYVARGCTRVRLVPLTELGFCSVPSSAGEGEIEKGRAQWQRDVEAPNCNNPDCRCQ
ncbi:MAG: hypothetical protein ACPIOQ_67330, partial [Promethearchaeia archaeon]